MLLLPATHEFFAQNCVSFPRLHYEGTHTDFRNHIYSTSLFEVFKISVLIQLSEKPNSSSLCHFVFNQGISKYILRTFLLIFIGQLFGPFKHFQKFTRRTIIYFYSMLNNSDSCDPPFTAFLLAS